MTDKRKMKRKPIPKPEVEVKEVVIVEPVAVEKPSFIDKIKSAEGLGDVVKAVTSSLGIETCDSCEERRKKMNESFSFLKNVKRELTEEEVEYVSNIEHTHKVQDGAKFVEIYNGVFGTHIQACNCPGLYHDFLQKLLKQIEKQKIIND